MRTVREKKKVALHLISALATREMAKAAQSGNRHKGRGPWNWRTARVKASDMIDGLQSHLDKLKERVDADAESGAHTLGHLMQRAAIFLEAQANGTLIDDRPPALRRRKGRR